MLKQRRMSTTKIISLSVVMIIIAGVIGYLLYGNFFVTKTKRPAGSRPPLSLINVGGVVTEFNVDFIKKAPYQDLHESGQAPTLPPFTSKPNPFLDFEVE